MKRRKKKKKKSGKDDEEEKDADSDTAPEAESDEGSGSEGRKAEVLKEHGKIGVTISMKKESPSSLKVSTSPEDAGRSPKASPTEKSGRNTPSGHKHHHRHRNKSDRANGDELITRPSEYWRNLNPVVDKILVTDVTSGSTTVTIRECATREGFFSTANEPLSQS